MDENLKKQFKDIKFVPETHQYFLYGEEYISVSSLMNGLVKPFDREAMSKRVADREGVSQPEIKALWDIRRDFSTVKGSEFHLYVEKYLKEKKRIETITPIEHEIKQFHVFWDQKNEKKYEVLAVELILYDQDLKLAGTLDCLLRDKKSQKTYIVDWKTNHEIKTINEYENFLPPLHHLDASDLNKYSLQTGFYRHMLETKTSLKITGSYLIHFSKGKNFEVINCRDYSKEIEAILATRKGELG